jgi:ribose 5-phosphate isomerase
MQIPVRSKTLSFVTDVDEPERADALADQLVALPGVIEATVVSEENRTYLKVNDKEFDLNQAKQALGLR